jgi:N6-L-threonylcarbamoyladenine synthase
MSKVQKDITILGIESSCDDTSAAVIYNGKILSNSIANQKVHEAYGGVVPELASRAHQQNIIPVVDEAMKKAGISKEELSAIAFTRGPGLLGSLLVGTSFAKSMGLALNIPIIEVNHMQAHILAHFIQREGAETPTPKFPFLCLTVSGGHTQIVVVRDFMDMEVVGETMDDAAGEAFDKAAKILGFTYPGGPLIDKYAKDGDPLKYKFPEPKVEQYNFSFSGLKTSFLNFVRKHVKENPNFVEENKADICASMQYAIVSFLMRKLKRAARELNINQIAVAGGVSANSYLRAQLQLNGEELGWDVFIPDFEFCTDNAGMIAITGYYKYQNGEFASQDIVPSARLKI